MSIVVIKFTKPTAALKKFIYNLTNFYFINDFKQKLTGVKICYKLLILSGYLIIKNCKKILAKKSKQKNFTNYTIFYDCTNLKYLQRSIN